MKRFESWLLGLSTLLVGGTGLALYVMKEWMSSTDPFAVVHHPLQPWMLRIHLVAVPMLVFAFGMIAREHIGAKLAAGLWDGRRSGLWALLFSLTLLRMSFGRTTPMVGSPSVRKTIS